MKKISSIVIIAIIIIFVIIGAYHLWYKYSGNFMSINGGNTDDLDFSTNKNTNDSGTVIEDEIKEIPPNYRTVAKNQGTVEKVDYKFNNLDKYAYVYLPYGYNEEDTESKYNVFYVLHGGGGSQETLFTGVGQTSTIKNILDNMIENGELEPLIVVAPTYYDTSSISSSISSSDKMTSKFHTEVVESLIPSIETKYNTYLETNSKDAMEKSREHRAFGGFSMGSVATWYELIYDLDYFKYFMPMSGDCWIKGQQGGASHSKETAEYLNNAISNSKYKGTDFFVYALTGTEDIAYNAEGHMIQAMRQYADNFIFDKDKTKGNYYFSVLDGGVHTYEYVLRYIYNALPYFWTK